MEPDRNAVRQMIYMLDVFEFKTSCTIPNLQICYSTAHLVLSLHNVDQSAATDTSTLCSNLWVDNPKPPLQVILGEQMNICAHCSYSVFKP